jgi:hypothetical protein
MAVGLELAHLFTGKVQYLDQYREDDDPRIVIPVRFGTSEAPTLAIVDTGGLWCILDPREAELVGLDPAHGDQFRNFIIRGARYDGYIYRIAISIDADEGKHLTAEGTIFVPRLYDDEEWVLPNFLGLRGFLERIRFAVDPVTNSFYFGAIDEGD